MEQSSSAALAAASASVANAISGARQELATSLKATQEMQTTAQAIRENRSTARIRELKNRKDSIDAAVALRGASATQDLLAQKRTIDAELDLLRSQQALAGAESDAARASDVAALRDEIEHLKVQVELLQRQLDLEKAKAALAATRASP